MNRVAALCALVIVGSSTPSMSAESRGTPPIVPVGYDAYRHWDRWAYQRI